jgi:hypothetical protein
MKAHLAMRLLADLMEWDETRATEEFAWLRLMVSAKYDHYQGYSAGARFYVHLISWIGQFQQRDRATAYSFIRKNLVFVSQSEMHHLVSLSMPIIQRSMRSELAESLKVPIYKTWGDSQAERRLTLMGMRTLYVSTEQVVAASEISEDKWKKLNKALRERLDATGFESDDALFERVCLIDDFTASGTTLIRDEGEWKGKIPTFCGQNTGRLGVSLARDCCIHVHHYLASNRATDVATKSVQHYCQANNKFRFALTFSAVLSETIVVSDTSSTELVQLLKDYYDPSIETTHLGNDVWFGYRKCGLPVVLYHNTPNNSVAALWATSGPKHTPPNHRMTPLFARKTRHVDHG